MMFSVASAASVSSKSVPFQSQMMCKASNVSIPFPHAPFNAPRPENDDSRGKAFLGI